jgi:lipopolysaccharide biosynthesis glycosyltransferase
MIIVSAADERFAPHFAAMLHSAWTHNPEAHFYLLDCGMKLQTLCKLATFASDHSIRLTTEPVDTARFHDLPTTKFFSPAIYARLLIHELLPSTERVIYLDADTLVVSSLDPLWRTDMHGAIIAGVQDEAGDDEEFETPYVNSGVLVLDLQRWRERQVSKLVIEYIRSHHLTLPDQSAINAVCANQIVLLDDSWNYRVSGRQRLMQCPRIIHFTGMLKPWLYSNVAFAQLYGHHRSQTPFPMLELPQIGYRPLWRRVLNLMIGRPKYWRRFLMQQRAKAFIDDYLKADRSAARTRLTPAQ